MKSIDLNSDVGERPEALVDGTEEQLIRLITSANIACGGHAGDMQSMVTVMRLCEKYGVAIGAHPSYPDRESFGRKKLDIPLDSLEDSIYEQVTGLCRLASSLGLVVKHVKPHGALYNAAAEDPGLASAIARAVARISKDFVLVGLAGSRMLHVWEAMGFKVAGEAFADRRYENDGSLRSRQWADALITDPALAAGQAVQIAEQHKVTTAAGAQIPVSAQTICFHSDTPGSLAIATRIRSALTSAGIELISPALPSRP